MHFDLTIDAYYNAAWILLSEPTGTQNVANTGAVPMRDREFPLDQGNPYDPPGTAADSRTQAGFATFGDTHVIEVLTEVIGLALRAVWWQKWGVHRRLRPEEYGGRVDNHLQGRRYYPLHSSILNSLRTGGLSPYFGSSGEKFGASYLLPQAFPEGAPTHPAYGAGHATVSGACVTILKAFFDESKSIENPMQSNADGTALVPFTGTGSTSMTVGSELNKLAGNIAIFRNAAGVHWRSDYTQSLLLGEQIAIRLLQELSTTFNEDAAYFQLTRLNGQTIRISDGHVDLVPVPVGPVRSLAAQSVTFAPAQAYTPADASYGTMPAYVGTTGTNSPTAPSSTDAQGTAAQPTAAQPTGTIVTQPSAQTPTESTVEAEAGEAAPSAYESETVA